jgi:sirohydrochlorin cobaltochelatase
MLSALEKRLEEALTGDAGSSSTDPSPTDSSVQKARVPRTPDDRSRITVLLVGGGSTDPYANAEVHKAARLLWEGRGYAGVETAFVSFAAPDVASGLDRCRKLGAKTVVVLPYLLFAGALSERVRQQSAGWAAANPDVEVRNADVIGSGEELTGLVLERYREAVESESGAARKPDSHTDGDSHARAL